MIASDSSIFSSVNKTIARLRRARGSTGRWRAPYGTCLCLAPAPFLTKHIAGQDMHPGRVGIDLVGPRQRGNREFLIGLGFPVQTTH